MEQNEKYMDASLPIEERVEDLLSRMTLEEKVGQLNQAPLYAARFDKVKKLAKEGKLGSCILAFSCFAGMEDQEHYAMGELNRVQRVAMEECRLHIPLIFGRDIIHGAFTTFPIPLGLAASWDSEVMKSAGSVMAEEAYYDGTHWTFAPMLDLSRDPRWGRIAESPGEDPYLAGVYAKAMVQGIQGDTPEEMAQPGKIAACAKHYLGYGASEGGRDYSRTEISDYSMRNYYLNAFREASDAGIATFMSSFNDINGQPTTSSEYYMRHLLKEELGFDGFVISDWDSIVQLINQGVAEDRADCARLALGAGVDMDMHDGVYLEHVAALVESGEIPAWKLDDSVRRVLRIKFRLGLFDNPYLPENVDLSKIFLTPEKKEKTRKAAAASMVLLKNNGVLPLNKDTNVIVSGPLADDKEAPLGCWRASAVPEETVTFLDGMNQVGKKVHYTRASIFEDFHWIFREPNGWPVVLALGESGRNSGEAVSFASIELSRTQVEYAKAAKAHGRQVIAVVYTGRPLALSELEPYCDAILVAWHPGTMGGLAAAQILYGDEAPCGRLPATFPRCTGQIPIYYNPTNNSRLNNGYYHDAINYNDIDDRPLYPFGYGLAYTEFTYSKLEADKTEISLSDLYAGGTITLRATVTNTGARDGKEWAQLYITDPVASMMRPIQELKGFAGVTIPAGESREVTFTVGEKELRFYNGEGQLTVEPGKFQIHLAKNAWDRQDTVTVTVTK